VNATRDARDARWEQCIESRQVARVHDRRPEPAAKRVDPAAHAPDADPGPLERDELDVLPRQAPAKFGHVLDACDRMPESRVTQPVVQVDDPVGEAAGGEAVDDVQDERWRVGATCGSGSHLLAAISRAGVL
jgi:hypothetical protein